MFYTGGIWGLVIFFTHRGSPTANRAKKRYTAGVSHQLPAWPGTTITSSSCSSSVTAVSRRRGCRTGSGPCLVFFFYNGGSRSTILTRLCTIRALLQCIILSFRHWNYVLNVHIRHIFVSATGRRLCVRAGHVSRWGRIPPPDTKDLSLENVLNCSYIGLDNCFTAVTQHVLWPIPFLW